LGFEVWASTSKDEYREKLMKAGAANVIDRVLFSEKNPKPMGKEEWAGAVDVVGGVTLVNILKTLRRGGSVAACGLVESPILDATVMPFILRGVNLLGVDSVELPLKSKTDIWEKLSVEWRPKDLEELATEISFAQLPDYLEKVLNGNAVGRYVLNTSK
jgi:alcohol dehydrogenase